jgi:RNA polymerase sigma-70 factor, ECF subfamily
LDDPDLPLVERVRAGDRGAFDELVARHGAALCRLVARYVKTPEDAADAAQEALLRAFERIGSFRGEAPFRAWLLRVGVNVALNRIRVTQLCEPLDLLDDERFTTSLRTTSLVAAELWRKIGERVSALPPKQRLAVELRLFHELTFDEIAGVMGTSDDAAKSNFHAGVKRLRGLLPSP